VLGLQSGVVLQQRLPEEALEKAQASLLALINGQPRDRAALSQRVSARPKP
jgi:hypothetical protein